MTVPGCCCRCSIPDMLSGLETMTSTLLEAELPLRALPATALIEHSAVHIAHDVLATVRARILRAEALCQLGLLAEAADVLRQLMQVCLIWITGA